MSGNLSQRGNSTRGAMLGASNTVCLLVIIAEKRGECKREQAQAPHQGKREAPSLPHPSPCPYQFPPQYRIAYKESNNGTG
ncbi:MAG TPA: hypothetical protein VFU49_02415 [Ktedonobacteraceae bacterium]|nr:hypothetical protein [Ktedonobacteraceae bacterium]